MNPTNEVSKAKLWAFPWGNDQNDITHIDLASGSDSISHWIPERPLWNCLPQFYHLHDWDNNIYPNQLQWDIIAIILVLWKRDSMIFRTNTKASRFWGVSMRKKAKPKEILKLGRTLRDHLFQLLTYAKESSVPPLWAKIPFLLCPHSRIFIP